MGSSKPAFGSPRRTTVLPRPTRGAPSPLVERRGERIGAFALARLPWLVLVLVGAALVAVGSLAISTDTWLGIAAGHELLRHGFTTHNGWTRFGSRGWADQQWAAHIIFYGVWRLAGPWGLLALHVALLTTGLALCLRASARRGGGAVWPALVLGVVAIANVGELVFVRTQSFAVLCFGLLAVLLTRDDGRLERRVLLALPLLAVWANLHASVLVGAAVCVLYAVAGLHERRASIGHAIALAVGACAACAATPFAAQLPAYLRETAENDDFRRFIHEWQPVTLGNSPIFVVVALGACAVAAYAPIVRRDRLLVWALTLVGFTAIRSELWAALAWLVVLPGALERVRPIADGARLRAAAVCLALVAPICLALAIAHDVNAGPKAFARTWPGGAAAVVRSQLVHDPGLQVFADEPLADWLLVTAPAVRGRLALDSRFETFSPEEFASLDDLRTDPLRISPGIAAEDVYVLEPAADGRLVRALEHERGVVRLYASDRIVVLRRR